jgi:dihydroneopterin aldolase
MDWIAIEGIESIGFHGVYPDERTGGNRFITDLYLGADLRAASESDRLSDTLDYSRAYAIAWRRLTGEPLHLLERLARLIGEELLAEFPAVEEVKVRIAKLRPKHMEFCRQTYVEMRFRRQEDSPRV